MSDTGVRASPLPEGFTEMVPGPGLTAASARVDRDACNGYELEEPIRARRKLISFLEAACLADAAALAYCPAGLVDGPADRSAVPEPHGSALLEQLLG